MKEQLDWDHLPDCMAQTYRWDRLGELQPHNIIADANTLYDAMRASRKNTNWKRSVKKYCWLWMKHLSIAQIRLEKLERGEPGAYKPKPGNEFMLNERGRIRPITGQLIDDRVISHALNDAVLLPAIRKYLIYDNTASLKHRGVDMTRRRLRHHLEQYYQRNGTNVGYVRIMDFSKYYDNIQHRIAYAMLCAFTENPLAMKLIRVMLHESALDVSALSEDEIIKMEEEKIDRVAFRALDLPRYGVRFLEKGVNVGDQMSQTIGILFPYQLDNQAKIVLGSPYYGRYMDDMIDMDSSLSRLRERGRKLEETAARLGLYVNPRKTVYCRMDKGFVYLQRKIRLLKDGTIEEKLKPKAVTKMCRRLKKLRRKIYMKRVVMKDVLDMYRSWIIPRMEYISYPQLRKLERLIKYWYGGEAYEYVQDSSCRWRSAEWTYA